jgi:transposase-like protein
MAKRKRAPARKTSAHKRKTAKKISPPPKPSKPAKPPKEAKPGRPFYTPEFLAEARRRIEHTTESMTSIAGKLGMHHSVLSKLIQREKWLRPEASLHQRGLSPAMRLAAEADALSAAPAPPDPAALDRIEQAVLKELETVEAMRASLDKEPLRPIDAERTARTLSIHAETLAKLRRHRLAAAALTGPDHDDDLPADLDAFRGELARRIRAFIASRTAGSDAERAGATAGVAAV